MIIYTTPVYNKKYKLVRAVVIDKKSGSRLNRCQGGIGR